MDDKKGGGNLTCFKSSTIVGLDEIPKANFVRIYPVPAVDKLTIDAGVQVERTEIYNLAGEFITTGSNETTIDISKLKPGTYFLKVITPKTFSTHKFVKQ
jgi:hypothetical protein